MTHIAKEFALSDVALHKVCRKHDIPKPPVGWWAKKAAGKNVRQTPLPAARRGISDRIVIAGGELRKEPEAVAAARELARVRASSGPVLDPRDHPIVAQTIARLRKAKAGPTGLVSLDGAGTIRCEVAPSSVERLEIILHRVVAAAAHLGFRVEAAEGTARFIGEEESVAFSITEAVRRVKHELTEKERVEEEKWARRQERARLRNEWDDIFFSAPRVPDWDWHPTGLLSFELEHVYVARGSPPRRSFRDAKIQRLETMAVDIAVSVAVVAAAKIAERLRREDERRRAEESRQLREAALRAKHVEERRKAALEHILELSEHASRLRKLLGALREAESEVTAPRVVEFVRWAKVRLAELEEMLSVTPLERAFAEQRLFGEDDG